MVGGGKRAAQGEAISSAWQTIHTTTHLALAFLAFSSSGCSFDIFVFVFVFGFFALFHARRLHQHDQLDSGATADVGDIFSFVLVVLVCCFS